MMLLSLEHYLIQKGSNMEAIIKFPLMNVVDEKDYNGNKTTVVGADGELSYLVNRFFCTILRFRLLKDICIIKSNSK